MFGWGFVSFYRGFGFDRRKELSCHHFSGSLNHSLAYTRNCPAYLYISLVRDSSSIGALGQIQISGAFDETRLASAFYDDAVVFRLAYVLEPDVSGEDAFDGADTGLERRRICVRASQIKRFAARDAALQDLGIDKRAKHAFALCLQLLSSFNLHAEPRGDGDSRRRPWVRDLPKNLSES